MRNLSSIFVTGLAALSLTVNAGSAQAAAGSLDSSFGNGGVVTTNFGVNNVPTDVILQPDGRIVVAFSNFRVARYLSTGALDQTFGNGGSVLNTSINSANAVALQPDGRIVLAGVIENPNVNEFAVVRYTSSGSLDTSFGSGGVVTTSLGFPGVGEAIVVQPDGKILLGDRSSGRTRHSPI